MQHQEIGKVDGIPVVLYKGVAVSKAVEQLPHCIVLDEHEAKAIKEAGLRLSSANIIVKVKRVVPTAYIERIT